MKLLVIRHAIAADREEWAQTGEDDRLRPLTGKGRKRMRAGARGLRRLVPSLDLLATSPLVRAVQTAEILRDSYGSLQTVVLDALAPDQKPDELLRWLQARPADSTLAIVGHEPHLSELIGWLLTGSEATLLRFKKGAACLLEFGGAPQRGGAVLQWALTPAQLRRFGR